MFFRNNEKLQRAHNLIHRSIKSKNQANYSNFFVDEVKLVFKLQFSNKGIRKIFFFSLAERLNLATPF